MLNFVVCDDDINMLNRLSSLLEKVILKNDFDAKVMLKTTDYNELLNFISSNKINVVILDVEFTGQKLNGLDVAKLIREIDKNCYLIFVTSHFEYIAEAYKYKTFDYIFKSSITMETLTSTLKRLFADISATDTLFLKIDNKNTLLDLNDIHFIEKDGTKLIYHTLIKDYVTYNSFNKLRLPENFVRCHKSFIVNINNITNVSLSNNIITFKDGSTCYIGPKYKRSLLEVIKYAAVS